MVVCLVWAFAAWISIAEDGCNSLLWSPLFLLLAKKKKRAQVDVPCSPQHRKNVLYLKIENILTIKPTHHQMS